MRPWRNASRMRTRRLALTTALLGALLIAGAPLASAARAATIDFDSLAPGTAVTTLPGVSFAFSDPGFGLIVSTGLETTSAPNYLGVDDGGSELFLPGDVVTLAFASPIGFLSASFVSTAFTPDGAFTLDVGASGSAVSGSPTAILPSGDEVFALAVSSPTPFSSARLIASDIGVFSFNVDDIVFEPARPVPEPGPLLLLLVGAVAGIVRGSGGSVVRGPKASG